MRSTNCKFADPLRRCRLRPAGLYGNPSFACIRETMKYDAMAMLQIKAVTGTLIKNSKEIKFPDGWISLLANFTRLEKKNPTDRFVTCYIPVIR